MSKLKTTGPGSVTGQSKQPDAAKATKKEFKFLDFTKETVIETLEENIVILMEKRRNFRTPTQLAGLFRMNLKTFRTKCFQDNEIAEVWQIYNGLHTESLYGEAIKSGKLNTTTEKYLTDELQAFTGVGQEQHIQWVLDDMELVDINGEAYELEVDVIKRTSKEEAKLWDK